MTLIRQFSIIIILIGMLVLSSCITIVAPKQSSPGEISSEPLSGEWQMTRLGIDPTLPFPDLITNQIISDRAVWKISRQSGQFVISYEGRDTWYKPILGIPIQKKQMTVTENQTKTSCAFTSGGSINVDKLPGIFSTISPQKMEQISLNFDDKVQINLNSTNKISAVINFNANGKYYGETEFGGSMKWKTLQQNTTITYGGTKN
jgi:hypothetical protein